MRVYTVDRTGAVKEDRGTVNVPYAQDLPPMISVNPPCECPRCRAGLVVR
ncbi:hypothetical protein [Streptomyces sp. YIM S03343]